MEKFESQKQTQEQYSVSESLEKLQRAADILREMGLEVIDRFITEDRIASEIPFPIETRLKDTGVL